MTTATAPTVSTVRDRIVDARALLVRSGVNAVPHVDRLLGELLDDLHEDAPPRPEHTSAKARRYLTEGRLTVQAVTDDTIDATCRGDSGTTYALGWHGPRWWCSCPERRGRCSHLIALRLVALAAGPDLDPTATP